MQLCVFLSWNLNCSRASCLQLSCYVALTETDALSTLIRKIELKTTFEENSKFNVGSIISQLKLIAKLIVIRNERGNGINRDVFFAE